MVNRGVLTNSQPDSHRWMETNRTGPVVRPKEKSNARQVNHEKKAKSEKNKCIKCILQNRKWDQKDETMRSKNRDRWQKPNEAATSQNTAAEVQVRQRSAVLRQGGQGGVCHTPAAPQAEALQLRAGLGKGGGVAMNESSGIKGKKALFRKVKCSRASFYFYLFIYLIIYHSLYMYISLFIIYIILCLRCKNT